MYEEAKKINFMLQWRYAEHCPETTETFLSVEKKLPCQTFYKSGYGYTVFITLNDKKLPGKSSYNMSLEIYYYKQFYWRICTLIEVIMK